MTNEYAYDDFPMTELQKLGCDEYRDEINQYHHLSGDQGFNEDVFDAAICAYLDGTGPKPTCVNRPNFIDFSPIRQAFDAYKARMVTPALQLVPVQVQPRYQDMVLRNGVYVPALK